MIDAKPFCLFADSEVIYSGRAHSTLARGNYLILYKADGSVAIHAATLVTPRNYLGGGSKVTIVADKLHFSRKGETITIIIHKLHTLTYLENWAADRIVICRTEKELAQKIFDNWGDYFDGTFEIIQLEVDTNLGPIDILGLTLTTDYVVEVKRKTATLKDVTQLRRYLEARYNAARTLLGYLAAPKISKRALRYLESHNLHYLQVDFD